MTQHPRNWLAVWIAALAAFMPSARAAGVEPITPAQCDEMKARGVMNPGGPVGCARLRLVKFSYVGFDGKTHDDGEIVVLDAVAEHVRNIFTQLQKRGFPIAKAKQMNAYNGDDDASMADNNTSAFNVRNVAGTTRLSMHSYGTAIDINPVQNPYVTRSGGALVYNPPASAAYADRKKTHPAFAESVRDIFTANGFDVWGGAWAVPDYQHFQLSAAMAERLARLSPVEAKAEFDRYVAQRKRG